MYSKTQREKRGCIQVGDSFTAFRSSPDVFVSNLTDKSQNWMLRDKNMLFLYDPGTTNTPLRAAVPAFTIVFASNPQNYRSLNKSNAYTLYMPVWSLEELKTCASLYGYANTVVEII